MAGPRSALPRDCARQGPWRLKELGQAKLQLLASIVAAKCAQLRSLAEICILALTLTLTLTLTITITITITITLTEVAVL